MSCIYWQNNFAAMHFSGSHKTEFTHDVNSRTLESNTHQRNSISESCKISTDHMLHHMKFPSLPNAVTFVGSVLGKI